MIKCKKACVHTRGNVNTLPERRTSPEHKFLPLFFVQFSVFGKELKNVCIICEFVVFY